MVQINYLKKILLLKSKLRKVLKDNELTDNKL